MAEKPRHTLTPTVYEREDGMAMMRIPNQSWILRAPIAGQARFWNGIAWIPVTLIDRDRPGYWPIEYTFSKEEATKLLETLGGPNEETGVQPFPVKL